jgi:hypothetical protein
MNQNQIWRKKWGGQYQIVKTFQPKQNERKWRQARKTPHNNGFTASRITQIKNKIISCNTRKKLETPR